MQETLDLETRNWSDFDNSGKKGDAGIQRLEWFPKESNPLCKHVVVCLQICFTSFGMRNIA